jgi:hypothetical protein
MCVALVQTERAVDPFEPGRELFNHIVQCLQSEEMRGMKHSDLERELEKQGCELMRRLLQGYMDSRAPGEAIGPVRDAQGDERTEKREHERDLETVFGTVSVERTGYLAEGKASLHPLDGELNLPTERYSHEVRHRAAEEAAKNSFDETVESLRRHTGAHIHKHQVEELVVRAALDFDAFYAEREAAARTDEESGPILVLTSDGKGVVMRNQDLREATRKAAERRKHKLPNHLSKGEKKNAKRMATVASVYTIAPYLRTPHRVARMMAPVHGTSKQRRPRPEHKRVWASLELEPEEVIEEAFREAVRRDPDKIRLMKKYARKYGVKLTIVLDIIHVLGYVWKAGFAFHGEGNPELQGWVYERLCAILRGRSSHVAAGMRRSATLRELDTKKREPVDRCADYLLKYKKHLAYDVYLAKGFPIATGVIEGACRHLVKDRMDLTGARWSLKGGEAVLRMRALRSSQDFDEYWVFHENREYERNHAAHYADGEVPVTKDRKANGRQHLNVLR